MIALAPAMILELEEMIRKDPGNRGIEHFFISGELEKAAISLIDANTVLIITGFYIASAGIGESDGPPGALILARALKKFGKNPILFTDAPNVRIVEAAMASLGEDIPLIEVPIEADQALFQQYMDDLLPTHVISIERPGRALDGCYYSMRGEDLRSRTAPLDWMILLANEKGVTTIGIGDGGNEVGMGRCVDEIRMHVPFGDEIACIVPADHLITAGITNWGAYALTAALSVLANQELLHTPEQESLMLKAMTEAGAVDGNLGHPALSIDGVPINIHEAFVVRLHELVHAQGQS